MEATTFNKQNFKMDKKSNNKLYDQPCQQSSHENL